MTRPARWSDDSDDHAERADFMPSAARARMLDQEMRWRLRSSLTYLIDRLAGTFDIPPGIQVLIDRLSDRSVPPFVYAAYADLVLAVQNGDRAEAERLVGVLASAIPNGGEIEIITLREPPNDGRVRFYRTHVDTDDELLLVPLSALAEAQFRTRFSAALGTMEIGCPALLQEIRGSIREILIVGRGDDPAFDFDGASVFTLWGGIVLNGESARSLVGLIQALTHESAHNLLFGLSLGHPIHQTDTAGRFSSPLRQDARPMEGIIHATFVIARMSLALRDLIASGVLDSNDLAEARVALRSNEQSFDRGLGVIERHAALTPFGERLFSNARRYMRSRPTDGSVAPQLP